MPQYSNKHLKEVVCTFYFKDDDSVKWDSSYFGQLYDLIKDNGFTKRQEKKGIKVSVPAPVADAPGYVPTIEEAESEMAFINDDEGLAITMSKARISFHIVKNYKGWGLYLENTLKPLLKIYLTLGLYSEPLYCQLVYLNSFEFDVTDDLSKFFTIASSPLPLDDFGMEGSVFTQKFYLKPEIGMIVRLRSDPSPHQTKVTYLECGASSMIGQHEGKSLIELAISTHEPIDAFFETIITSNLRAIL